MPVKVLIKVSQYYDSVSLMLVARELVKLPGVNDAAVVMATEANKGILQQAGMLTAVGLAEIERSVSGLQFLPMMFRTLEEVDYIGEKLQPMLVKRLEEKGFVALFWTDTGWVRFFSKQVVIRPDDLRKTKFFVWAGSLADVDLYRSVGLNPVPLETVDIPTCRPFSRDSQQ